MMLILLYISTSKGGPVGKSLVRAIALAMALGAWSAATYAAGLGKLNVVSSLGQPFRAEIDLVSVKKDEASSLAVKLASPDAFKQADLPFVAYVSGLKLSVEKRPNGDSYVKVVSYQPLNEPFIDFLVELSWTSGRLVRAYTALVDPPTITDTEAAKPAPEVKAAPAAPEPRAEPAPAKPAPGAVEAAPSASVPATGSTPKPITGGEVKVKRGDTLEKIAQTHKLADVSLDQMLVLLYRNNAEAFVGKNMNRLRAGRVLRLPDATEVAAVTAADAHKEVRVQAADWNAYRERLAAVVGGAAAAEAGSGRSASGSVTTKVEDKVSASPEAPKEVLKLSKGEPGKSAGPAKDGKAGADRVRSLEEEVVAKNKTVEEANMRVATLEKTVKDMQVLMEMKSKSGAEASKLAAAPSPPAAAREEKPVAIPPVEPAKTLQPGTAAAPVPAVPGATQEPLPPPKPQRKFVLPPPPPPANLVDEVLQNPALLGGGIVGLLGLGGVGYMMAKRRRTGVPDTPATKAAGRGIFKKNPVADETVAVADNARRTDEASAISADPDEEGDALAEAEIFLTYGRDNLAEERLKEAIAATPKRYELHGKLLELYAKRKDVAAFDQIAKELQIGTGGRGELWNKAVALGHQIDPENPRYASARPGAGSDDGGATTVVTGVAGLAAAAAAADAVAASAENLDFNLGFDEAEGGPTGTSTDIDLGSLSGEATSSSLTETDFDVSSADSTLPPSADNAAFDPGATLAGLGTEATVRMSAPVAGTTAATAAGGDLDFDFDVSGDSALSGTPEAASAATPEDDGGIMFDLSDMDMDMGTGSPVTAAPDIDLSGIDLDLGGGSSPASGEKDEKWYDVQTKFDLAKAYQEMGDKEGAREILQEVLEEGDAEQKKSAQTVLAALR